MKRSEINRNIRQAMDFMSSMNFRLPPFAKWSLEEWKSKGLECRDIIEEQLGWDITDFGKGRFEKYGLLLFTLRNGTMDEIIKENGKVYAEKIMIVQEQQVTPMHMHYQKTEDIINRGGGNLVIQVWNSVGKELADTDVILSVDGVRTVVKAGGLVILKPGESVCLRHGNFHMFWGEKGAGTVLVGEVSRLNDDHTDNYFIDGLGRFPEIEEDEPPLFLLYNDYSAYFQHC